MVTAYVMVKSIIGEVDDIRDAIKAIDGVVDAHIVAGDVDVIAKLAVESPDAIKDLVADHVHGIDGIDSTTTYIAMD